VFDGDQNVSHKNLGGNRLLTDSGHIGRPLTRSLADKNARTSDFRELSCKFGDGKWHAVSGMRSILCPPPAGPRSRQPNRIKFALKRVVLDEAYH